MSVVASAPRAPALSLGRDRIALVGLWAGSRLYVLGAAVAIQVLGIDLRGWQPGFRRHPFELLVRWDGHWYRAIANSGYLLLPGHHSDTAFFPLYPLLLRGAGAAGMSEDAVGLVVSNLAFLGALLLVHELARAWVGEETAWRATALLAIFPFSGVFSMTYPESLGLLAICVALLAARRGRWGVATVAAFAAGLTRPEAVVYSLPLLAEALAQRPRLRAGRLGLAVAAVGAAPAAAATFLLYLGQTAGSVWAWRASEITWGRTGGVTGPVHAFVSLFARPTPWLWRDFAAALLYLGGLRLALRAGVPRAYVAAGAAVILLPVLSGSFVSISRFGLLAPAAFVGFAVALRDRWATAVAGCLVLGFGVLVSLTASAP